MHRQVGHTCSNGNPLDDALRRDTYEQQAVGQASVTCLNRIDERAFIVRCHRFQFEGISGMAQQGSDDDEGGSEEPRLESRPRTGTGEEGETHGGLHARDVTQAA